MDDYRALPEIPPHVIRYRINSTVVSAGWSVFSLVFGGLFIAIGFIADAPSPRIGWAATWIAGSLVWFLPLATFRSGADLTIDHGRATVSVVVRGLSLRATRKRFPLARVKGAIVEPDEDGEHCRLALVIEGEEPFGLSMERPACSARHAKAAEEIRKALEASPASIGSAFH